jgi:hypothetical protein
LVGKQNFDKLEKKKTAGSGRKPESAKTEWKSADVELGNR